MYFAYLPFGVVHEVVRGMGWKPRMAEKLVRLGEPRREDVLMLRCFGPDRYFLGRLEEK